MSKSPLPRSPVNQPLTEDPAAATAHVLQHPAAAPSEERDRPFILAATIIATAMAFIDHTVVNIALPTIQADFLAGFPALQWVVNAYALMLGSLILVGGGLGDRLGKRRLFVIGTMIFGLSSIGCALAPNIETLITARAVQGLGAAMLVPQSLAIIAATFPRAVRGRAIGIWAGTSALTTAMGPPIGGFLIEWFDWRAIFWINIPLCLVVVALSIWRMPKNMGEQSAGPLDLWGSVAVIIGLGAFTLALTLYAEGYLPALATLGLSVAGLLALVAFLAIERRAENPLVPLHLFQNRTFSGINAMTVLLFFALYGVLFLVPFDLIAYRELTSSQVGLVLLPFGLTIGLLSRFSGAYADRNGPRFQLVAGSLLVAFAMVLLSIGFSPLWLGTIVPIFIMAVGMAMVVAPLTAVAINAAPDQFSGAASGINNAAARIAGLLAVAILGTLASLIYVKLGDNPAIIAQAITADDLRFGTLPATGETGRDLLAGAFRAAFSTAMLAAAFCAFVAALIAWHVVPTQSGTQNHENAR